MVTIHKNTLMRMETKKIFWVCVQVLACWLISPFCYSQAIKIESLSVEYSEKPLGIDNPVPRLSWILQSDVRNQSQKAYQVRVASSLADLDRPDVWDSRKVLSDRSHLIPYGGSPLRSGRRYYWSVRVWDAQGNASAWSKPSWWEMGLLSKADWKAQWIGRGGPVQLPPAIIMKVPADTAKLEPGRTQGQTFTSDHAFTTVGAEVPTFESKDSSFTLSLYKDGPGGELVARRRILNHLNGDWATLILDLPAPPGKYYLEQSEVTGKVGWYTYRAEGYAYGDAYADGKADRGDRKLQWNSSGQVPSEGLTAQLRKDFQVKHNIKRARLYISALGVYQAEINGVRVGSDFFAPGWTDYQKRVQYQTYDVTGLLHRGDNAIGVILGPGWYAGHVGSFGPRQYGQLPYLLAQLELDYVDGSRDVVVSDGNWTSHLGPIISSDLLMGTKYDARMETPGWSRAGYQSNSWIPVRTSETINTRLVAQIDPPVRVQQELQPKAVTRSKSGSYIFDLGQNMVGIVRLRVSGKAGQVITIRHGEALNRDGTLYYENLRSAKATDEYILKGSGIEVFEPIFTFHGFRYVEVSGVKSKPEVIGRVLHTAAPLTMKFAIDVPMINRLQQNILWSQRGNFLSVPMDTPARDERLGWTGDIAAFVGTAAYNMESATFLRKWMIDLRDTQSANGAFADVAPAPRGIKSAEAGWGDAGILVPWILYERYGDIQILQENFDAMDKWLSYLKKNSVDYVRPAVGYGDWLNVKDETPKDLIATAFFAQSAAIMSKVARVLGKDPKPYDELLVGIRAAFGQAFVLPSGLLKGDTQTAYVLALTNDLLPQSMRAAAADRLVQLIKARDWHLSTGFLGTPRLLPALSNAGRAEVAFRLLQQTSFPSWGYQIQKGATTMWERWDAVKPDGSFQDKDMNSLNHYAYGSVGEWMYQNIAGIWPDAAGFRKILVRPSLDGQVRESKADFQSPYGKIVVNWKSGNARFSLNVHIPVNASAQIWIPRMPAREVQSDGARYTGDRSGYAIFEVGSGRYHFSSH